jgi:glycosyltransferase involved in cell wall biosynthesis
MNIRSFWRLLISNQLETTTQSQKKLTIAIPSHNGASNFVELFASINNLGLEESEYELLVVDNNSTDGTDEVLSRLSNGYSNLRYHQNSRNIGRIENWNRAIELSTGKYLIIMNVNDRFLKFDIHNYLLYLDNHPEIPMVFADIQFKETIYPNWLESGVISLEAYLKKTFLDRDYLEFHSVGILHQHIFKRSVITENNIRFDSKLPRTTDRVFVGEVVKAGGGNFYYTNKPMVSWHLNQLRYHNTVHNDKEFNFNELWINEYEANLRLSQIGNIPFQDFLKSQLTLASSYTHKKRFRNLTNGIFKLKPTHIGMEFPTAAIYYEYLKAIARLNGVSINHLMVSSVGFMLVIKEFLTHHGWRNKHPRSIKGLLTVAES